MRPVVPEIIYPTGACVVIYSNLNKMQLDVGVSPPANIMTFRLGFTYLTFDLDPCHERPQRIFLVTFFFLVRQTDIQTDRQMQGDT